MRFSTFNENDSVLLVGEGNFSFAVSLFKILSFPINLLATCYESIVNGEYGKKNIEYLVEHGVPVLLGVDATKLFEHPVLSPRLFNKIIFNFPHIGGKMRIERNRELLQKFFVACETLLATNGKIIITLCNGQGGTPVDHPIRCWNDSWKVVEMAAHGNFMLIAIDRFDWSAFHDYKVTGYRSLEKSFHTAGALTHIFGKSVAPNEQNIKSNDKINITNYDIKDPIWENIIDRAKRELAHNCNHSYIYPPTFIFDITLSVNVNFKPCKLFEVLYENAGSVVDNVTFLYSYMSPDTKKVTVTYRITYRSYVLPLHRNSVLRIHQNWIVDILEGNLNVTVPR